MRVTAQSETIGSIGLTAGWATFGIAVPQGAATDGLQVGNLVTQTDVKNRWSDGSIRFAILTVNSPGAATYEITAGNASTGTLTATPVDASVSLTIGTTTYVATLPASPTANTWLTGPLVREHRAVVAPTASGAAHPFLRVNFDTRVYQDGDARLDVSVENMLDKTGAATVTYNVAIDLNGATVYSRNAVQHYYLTRWRQVFHTAGTTVAAVTPDLTPFNQARALPPYLSTVTNVVSSPTGTNFEILKAGVLDTNMPAHGGRAELAPYPDWTARYLVHRNATQRSFVLAHGDLSGSWPVHVREDDASATAGVGSERLVSLDQRPTIWYDSRAKSAGQDYIKGSPLPIREYGSLTPGPGQSPLIPDTAHQPSLAYVPYLLTGDRYYAEEMAFWANYSMLRTYPADGVRSSKGILAYNEVRGYGWGLRNMVEAAAYYPDASPVKAYLTHKVVSNLEWLDAYATREQTTDNPFHVLWLDKRPEGAQWIGLWEQNYLAYAIDRAVNLGFPGGRVHRDAIARLQLRLFTSEPQYPRAQAAPYVVGIGTPVSGGVAFYQTMSEIWSATQSQTRPFAGYYGPEARLNLMIGIEGGWTGAQDAYTYLMSFLGSDLAQRAGWALAFYPTGSSPTPPPPPPPPTPVLAQLLTPTPGATLTSTTQTFTWDAGTGVSAYRLTAGSTAGASDIYNGTSTTYRSATVSGLPSDGRSFWVRLYSNIDGSWQVRDYSYRAYTSEPTPPPPPTPVLAQLLTPAPGATLTSTTQTFTWDAGTGVSAYRLTAGSTAGANDIYNGTSTTYRSATVSGLPSDGRSFWVRLYSNINGSWQARDYSYRAYTAPVTGVLPSPWQSADIGSVGLAGNASYANSAFTVNGAGADIWGTADSMRFVYRSLTGDGEIIARVVSLQNTDPWAKAGVMIRDTLNANAKHLSMLVTPSNGVNLTRRTSTGGNTGPVAAGAAGPKAPYWVRVVRRGSTFRGYSSNDGVNWVLHGSATISMNSTVRVGLAVTSHTRTALARAVFDKVTVK
jgi:hypothetical protein